MTTTLTQRIVLGVTGLVGVGFGAILTFAPMVLHATYGMSYAPDPSLLSEIRAAGTVLLTMSAFILAGILRPELAGMSLAIGAGVFLAWGAARLLFFAIDIGQSFHANPTAFSDTSQSRVMTALS